MKRQKIITLVSCFFFLISLSLCCGEDVETPTAAHAETVASAKRNALDLGEVLLNDGFRIRDGAWNLSLAVKKPRLLQVTLFAGNQYWFIAAASPPASLLEITLYDASGHPVKLDCWKDDLSIPGARAAGGLVAPHSGKYFLKLELVKSQGGVRGDVCLVYGYK